jgi:ribosome maturation factor RimP
VNREDVTEKVKGLVEAILKTQGLELVDIEWHQGRGTSLLCVFIDKEGGVTVDDCANVSWELGLLLDVEDVIEHSYTLEVSSPGINRVLKRPDDFERFIGQNVKIKTITLINNRRNFKGKLIDIQNEVVTVLVDNENVAISLKDIEKAKLHVI